MAKPKIVAHTIMKNEENWIWYCLTSVVDYVDEIMVWDTGSTDNSLKIVNSINNEKIKLVQRTNIDENSFTNVRQEMLSQTKADWLMILDADEIWPDTSIRNTINQIYNEHSSELDYLISPYLNLVGDVFHYQEIKAGNYQLDKYKGHITIRFLNLHNLPGLHFAKPHGQQGIYDNHETLVQERDPKKYVFMQKDPYIHTTHLHRSGQDSQVIKRDFKYKYEWGISTPKKFEYPISFYFPRPNFVSSPWEKANLNFWTNAIWQTPIRMIKRRLTNSKVGY